MAIRSRLSHLAVAAGLVVLALGVSAPQAALATDCSSPFDPAFCWCAVDMRDILIGMFVDEGGESKFLVEASFSRDATPRYRPGDRMDPRLPISHGFGQRFLITSTNGDYWTVNSLNEMRELRFVGAGASTGEGGVTFDEGCKIHRDALQVGEALASWEKSCMSEVRRDLELPTPQRCDGGGCAADSAEFPSWVVVWIWVAALPRLRRGAKRCQS